MHLALYQPEIPGNVGTLIRLSACWGFPLDVIGPLGFLWTDRHFKRACLDYHVHSSCTLYSSWEAYKKDRRLIYLVPHEGTPYFSFSFKEGDTLVVGSESVGLPSSLWQEGICVFIPMKASLRSLNIAVAASIVMSEAFRQTSWLFKTDQDAE